MAVETTRELPAAAATAMAVETTRELPAAAVTANSPSTPRTTGLPAWVLPAAAVLMVLAALWVFRSAAPKAAEQATAQLPASSTKAEPANRPASTRRFALDGLSSLAASSLPRLRDIPAGAYARAGATAVRVAAFRIGETEVTVADFQLFVGRSHYNNPEWTARSCEGGLVPAANWENPGYSQTGSHPVVCVSQLDATAYAAWLTQETTRHFRLPTEAEWEYAAAAGAATEYWWGNQIDDEHAVCADCGRTSVSPNKPLIVSSLGQNAFGLYGVAGNVREWTCSPKAPPLAQACVLDDSPVERIVRGGSWHDSSIAMSTTYRSTAPPSERNTWTGFRIVEDFN